MLPASLLERWSHVSIMQIAFRLLPNELDEMLCKLDSIQNARWFGQYQTLPESGAAICIWSVVSSISNLNPLSWSLLPPSVEKRPMRLRFEIEIEWHSKCNRLYFFEVRWLVHQSARKKSCWGPVGVELNQCISIPDHLLWYKFIITYSSELVVQIKLKRVYGVEIPPSKVSGEAVVHGLWNQKHP